MGTASSRAIARRTFLARLSGSTIAGLAAVAAGPGQPGGFRLEDATCERFARHLGERFTVEHPDGTVVRLRLVEAVEAPARFGPDPVVRPTSRHPFSVLFHGPSGRRLAQETVRVRHEALGEFPLFLVPIGPASAPACYQAVFG